MNLFQMYLRQAQQKKSALPFSEAVWENIVCRAAAAQLAISHLQDDLEESQQKVRKLEDKVTDLEAELRQLRGEMNAIAARLGADQLRS